MSFSSRTDLVDGSLPELFNPDLEMVLIVDERVGGEPLSGFVLEEPEDRF